MTVSDQAGGPPWEDPDAELEEELRELLAELGIQVKETPALSEEEQARSARAAEEALARIFAASPPRPVSTSASRRLLRYLRRPWVTGLTVACACLLIAAATISLLHGGSGGTGGTIVQTHPPEHRAFIGLTPPMAKFQLAARVEPSKPLVGQDPTSALETLAAIAEQQPQPGSGPIQQVVVDGWFLTGQAAKGTGTAAPSTLVPTITHQYFLPDGRVRQIEQRGQPLEQGGLITQPPVGTGKSTDETFRGPAQGPSYARELPIEPGRLISKLIPDPAECPQIAACLAADLVDLNSNWVLPPDLVAAGWRALAKVPDVTYLGRSTDRLGHPALAFAVPAGAATRQMLLFADPHTGQLTGIETVLIHREPDLKLSTPSVINFYVFTQTRRITSMPNPAPGSSSAPDPSGMTS